jgi:hypothetical protein
MRRLPVILITIASSSLLSAQNWSAWKPDPVFHGIQVRQHCAGFNEFANRYVWDVQLRNTYKKDVDLAWAAEPGRLHGADAPGGMDQCVALRIRELSQCTLHIGLRQLERRHRAHVQSIETARVVQYRAVAALFHVREDGGDHTLDAFVRLLRNKVDGSRREKLIHTVRGVGYMLRAKSFS